MFLESENRAEIHSQARGLTCRPIGLMKAYPVDSGGATCCVLNDRIRPVAGTTIDGQRAFAFAISESVF